MSSFSFLHLLVLQIILFYVAATYSQSLPYVNYCSGSSFNSSSSYASDLQLLDNLTHAISPSFYSTHAIGTTPFPRISALKQCRPDATAAICAECLDYAVNIGLTNAKRRMRQQQFCLLPLRLLRSSLLRHALYGPPSGEYGRYNIIQDKHV
ncbi:hypothetical protein HPP92_012005 [Vanilla planifolia]|uniref:Gnk2-homologous domain-containing protein n=1 Tax=Vanilla planifolia TaxID=51239 RepID=A0A835R1P6_VANPL|nr:hypothetical protein HPP92_012005 [Vanilla planifolia]